MDPKESNETLGGIGVGRSVFLAAMGMIFFI